MVRRGDFKSVPQNQEDSMRTRFQMRFAGLSVALLLVVVVPLSAQTVTYQPYIQPGDNGPFGPKDQMVVTWQTNDAVPVPSAYSVQFGISVATLTPAVVAGRVVDNYLSVDPQFAPLALPFKYGAHSNYTAVLS